jgi:hypothetical protein
MNTVKQMFGMLVVSESFARGAQKLSSSASKTENFSATVARSAAIIEAVDEKGISRFISPSGVETATIRAEKRRSLWLALLVALPIHPAIALGGVAVYGRKLAIAWPGDQDLSRVLFYIMILLSWMIPVLVVTIVRSARLGSAYREEKRRVALAAEGFFMETAKISKARARFIAYIRGAVWVFSFHLVSGLLLELLRFLGISNSMIAYVTFPMFLCLMGAAYGLLDRPNRGMFAISVAINHILFCGFVMLFLLPGNITQNIYFALKYLDKVVTHPYDNIEQILVIVPFLSVWFIMIIFAIGHRKSKQFSPVGETLPLTAPVGAAAQNASASNETAADETAADEVSLQSEAANLNEESVEPTAGEPTAGETVDSVEPAAPAEDAPTAE